MTGALITTVGKTNHKNSFSPERQIGGISALERIVLLLQMAGIKRIAVVGDEDSCLQKLVPSMNLVFLTASSQGEMLDSIKEGISYLQDTCKEIFIVHVNMPMFSQETVQKLLSAKEEVCIPQYQGRCGHPVLIRQSCFEKILSYEGGNGLRGAIEKTGCQPCFIETDDMGILSDGVTDISYEMMSQHHDVKKLSPVIQLFIRKERLFYGPEVRQLLQLTKENGSLSSACQHMGISYTKGRKMISRMEEQTGNPVLETKQGGRTGGSSQLTENAEQIMLCYDAFQQEAEEAVKMIFQKYFGKN